MKLNRTWAMVVAIVMALTLSLSGTLAYLQDTDEAVNVMTLGNVQIEQLEYEREAQTNSGKDKLQKFTPGKPIYPSVGERAWVETNGSRVYQEWPTGGNSALYDTKLQNVIDKFVFVENTGKSDAYVRTIFAFELGEMTQARWDELIHLNLNSTHWTWWDADENGDVDFELITADGVTYAMTYATYTGSSTVHTGGILHKDETTRPSLLQFDFNYKTTNEDLDCFGNTYEILVVSQAVQAAGFSDAETALDEAFGEISATNHPWTEGVEPVVVFVSSDEELNAALEDATVSEIVLNSGNYGVIDVRVNRTLTISAAADADVTIAGVNGQTNNNNTNLTIKGVTIDNSKQTEGWYIGTSKNIKPCVGVWGGNYTFENCDFVVSGESGAETGVMSWWTTNHGVMNFKNCTFNGGNASARGMQIYGNFDLNVEGCTFNTEKDYSIKYVGDEGCAAVLKNNTVNATKNFVQLGSAPYAGENYSITFTGNTLANGINHVLVDNVENQTIIIDGVEKAATAGAIY